MKRILVISDSHGRNDDIEGVLKQVGHIDYMIHCGDLERGEEYVRALVDCPVTLVAGNNDYYLDLPMEEVIELWGYKILVTHGHYHYVNSGVDNLKEYARRLGVDIAMYGHTHVPYFEVDEDLTVLNPGSLTYPRQADRKPTFLMMEIDNDGVAHFGHGYYGAHFDELNI
jgi:hypothetical protein